MFGKAGERPRPALAPRGQPTGPRRQPAGRAPEQALAWRPYVNTADVNTADVNASLARTDLRLMVGDASSTPMKPQSTRPAWTVLLPLYLALGLIQTIWVSCATAAPANCGWNSTNCPDSGDPDTCPGSGNGGGGGSGCSSCEQPLGAAPGGMAAWSVDLPSVNLRITDTPLSYQPCANDHILRES
jgi:hypothetical protein